jgi:hypothetical protein
LKQLPKGKKYSRRNTLISLQSSCDLQNFYHFFPSKDTTKDKTAPLPHCCTLKIAI